MGILAEAHEKGFLHGKMAAWAELAHDPRVPESLRAVLQDEAKTPFEKSQAVDRFTGDAKQRRAHLSGELRHMDRAVTALNEMIEWLSSDLCIERLETTSLHHLQRAMKRDETLHPTADVLKRTNKIAESRQALPVAGTFVVQHDWAAAFKNAEGYDGHEYRLPYNKCAFEFRINGKKTVWIVHQDDEGNMQHFCFIATSVGWVFEDFDGDTAKSMEQFMERQIMAICVSLEAEVAETEVIRAPHKLNAAREKRGELPVMDHHIVSLARRVRAIGPSAGGTHRSPRLHFRRGHWRHYDDYKTWIRWTLVGNPELGFIEKEYRL